MAIAGIILALFALLGQQLLAWFGIEQASLHVAGGVILFLVALKIIFGSAAELFRTDEHITRRNERYKKLLWNPTR